LYSPILFIPKFLYDSHALPVDLFACVALECISHSYGLPSTFINHSENFTSLARIVSCIFSVLICYFAVEHVYNGYRVKYEYLCHTDFRPTNVHVTWLMYA